jgi:hypothetical protein
MEDRPASTKASHTFLRQTERRRQNRYLVMVKDLLLTANSNVANQMHPNCKGASCETLQRCLPSFDTVILSPATTCQPLLACDAMLPTPQILQSVSRTTLAPKPIMRLPSARSGSCPVLEDQRRTKMVSAEVVCTVITASTLCKEHRHRSSTYIGGGEIQAIRRFDRL